MTHTGTKILESGPREHSNTNRLLPIPKSRKLPYDHLSSDFDPATCWLDGHSPQHPHFDDAARIHFLQSLIKGQLLDCILEGCRILLQRHGANSLSMGFESDILIWKACVSMHKYGVIYLGSRTDCRMEFLPVLESNMKLFAKVDSFLCSDGNVIRAINYGVHSWATRDGMTVEYPAKLVPPYAISSIALNHIAVRRQDFEGDGTRMLERTEALWDLHDFAHHTTTALSPSLYGSKYFTHLINLPPRLTSLIRSPGIKTSDPTPRCSDGVVFSEFLTPLFEEMVDSIPRSKHTYTYHSMTDNLADKLAAYLMQERALRHNTTGVMIAMKAPITPEQLAVLAQNKAYELTASEIEQRVMTRGGPAGDERDTLDTLSTAERIRHLAASNRWMYFEVRNTIKHRAHKLAYQKVAQRMLARTDPEMDVEERELVMLTFKAMMYENWQTNEVANLWETLL